MQRNRFSIGILLIVVALILILGKLGVFSFLGYLLWPLLLLAVGLGLHFLYFSKLAPSGILVPGGILVTYSFVFFICNLFGWHLLRFLWPLFIFGLAVGLYELYLFDRNSPRQLMPIAVILGALSALFLVLMFMFSAFIYVVAILLVIAGVFLLMRRPKAW